MGLLEERERSCTRDPWLDPLPATGGLSRLRPDRLAEVLGAAARAIDARGGRFTVHCTPLVTTAVHAGTR
ncbi:hypothetical protein ACFWIQ_24385 [Kitasatospora sp. NPDC127059]|uniref:hypothetical protein n=1 Tax=unclassified Kitasatospora TaxID=2633591 RepID=UPI003654BCE4